jgi:DNA invertase Pin-like site-specific DNA recombinase
VGTEDVPAGTPTVIYARISLDKNGNELGVERQEKMCRELCDKRGWPIVAVIRENSVSATRGKRPGFEKLLNMRPEHIVMWSSDRLFRKGKDLEALIDLDKPIHSVLDGPMTLSTPSGRMQARFHAIVNTFEGEMKGERQKAAAVQRAQMGKSWWPRRPFGLEFDGSLRVDEATALAGAYEALLSGATVMSLAAELNRLGMVTNTGKPWTASSLRPVLLNPRNAGIRTYAGEEVGKAAWQPIVPEDVFRAAVRLLTRPERRTGGGGHRKNLLSGVAICSHCSATVKTAWRGKRGEIGAYRVYECRGKHCLSHRADWLDQTVEGLVFAALRVPSAASIWMSSGDGDVEEIREEVVKVRDKMREYEEDREADMISRESFLRMYGAAREKLAELEKQLDAMTGDSPVSGLLKSKDMTVEWAKLDLDKKRAVVQHLIRKVELKRRGKGRSASGPEHIAVHWNATPGQADELELQLAA